MFKNNTDIHLAICDDEANQRQYLSALVTQWAGRNDYTLRVDNFESAEQFAYGKTVDYDILLLDIQMGKQSGVELAKELRKEDERLIIIFITAMPDFIQEGYDVSALHYLMKPVDENKLFAVLDKAVMRIARQSPTLLLPVDGDTKRVAVDDILYIESFAHYSEVVTISETSTVKIPISKLEEQLRNKLVRSHRSYLVNIKRIARITKTDVVLDNGKVIPLSRRLYGDVNKAFINYFKGCLRAGGTR
jgi:DNA-binding LytR/AlgR family response regulator